MTTRTSARTSQARQAAEHRARVLARRKTALIVLVVAVIATLVAAIVTGSWPILISSLVVDVLLAAYVAILLQVKQGKGGAGTAPASDPYSAEDYRVVEP